jgi:probable F420-dependent oxidoreductase
MQFAIGMIGQSLYPGSQKLWWEDIGSDEIVRMVQRADGLGFDMVRIGEHIVMHEDWVDVMGPRWVDCVSALAFVAGATKQIKVISGIIVLPYHNPIELAKALGTIDYFSGGRLIFTAALGYMEWEYELLKVPFAERGATMDEYLDAIIELWTSDKPVFDGKYVQFNRIVFDPKPRQQPRPPIWLGGHSKASPRRAARVGEGWMPWGITRAQLPGMLESIRSQSLFAERPRKFDIFMTLFEGEIDPATTLSSHPRRLCSTRTPSSSRSTSSRRSASRPLTPTRSSGAASMGRKVRSRRRRSGRPRSTSNGSSGLPRRSFPKATRSSRTMSGPRLRHRARKQR